MIEFRSPTTWPLRAQYVLALGTVLLALAVRWLLNPVVGDAVPFVTVFAALVVLVLVVRPGPFLAATLVAWVGGLVLFIGPPLTLVRQGRPELMQALLFGIAGAAAVVAARLSHRAQTRRREADEELMSRGEELRLITDHVPALISYIDRQVRYRFVNARYVDWFGKPADEIVGRSPRELLDRDVFERVLPHLQAALAGRRSRFEGTVPRPADGPRYIIAEYVPHVGADGSVEGVYALVTDVSDQKRADEARAQLAAIVEASGDAMVSVSLEGEILTWNTGAERLFGYPAAEAVGRSIELIIPADRSVEEQSVLERVRTGELVASYDTVRARKDGTRVEVSVTVSPIRDAAGRVVGASKVGRDITERLGAERALHESERRLATLVANLPGVAYRARYEPRLPVELVSEGVRDVVGYDADELVAGRVSWLDLIHPEDRERARTSVRAAVRERRPYVLEYRVRHRDGSERWVWEQGEPIYDAGGELLALEGFISDVTHRKRTEQELEASRARERSYLEHFPVGVWFANEKGELTYSNEAARRIWGGGPLVGPEGYEEYEAYWHGTDRPIRRDEWALPRVLRSGEAALGEELDIVAFDGTRKIVLNSVVPVRDPDGAITGAVVMNQDITEQKEAEAALREADRRKDEFLATLAHELRNPLAAVHSAVELLLHRAQMSPEQIDRTTEVVQRQVALMVRLIDDLLDVSRITRGRLELRNERVSVPSLVDEAIEPARSSMEQKGLRLQVDVPDDRLEVDGDRIRLVQVFSNVLTNAFKYSHAGGLVRVSIRREGGEIVVEISDSGVGIPADKVDSIFEMFSQLETPGHGRSGLGIGLTLSRRLVELHGGTMWAASPGLGHGTTVTVRLPAVPRGKPEPPKPSVSTNHVGTARHARRVLIVDDNVDAAETLSSLLSARGHVTRTAYDGTTALAGVAEFAPEAILLDLGLPDIDGVEVCRAVRAQQGGKDILVVALSGWGQERDKRRTAQASFDAHLTKPADIADIDELLRSARPPAGGELDHFRP